MSTPEEISAAEANNILSRIAQGKGCVPERLRGRTDPESVELLQIIESTREELGDVVETIARDIYSRKARFILELIQNAEDNDFSRTHEDPSISFEVFPDKIIVECNEDGFTEANVQSICRTGKSSKKARGYIGEKGIGFKSVFQVASSVHIQSNSFAFSFKYNGGSTSLEKLGIITPIPEGEPIPQSQRPLTRMTLTTIQSIPYDELLDQFNIIPDTLLLFLTKLKLLQIKIHKLDGSETITTFRKSENISRSTKTLTTTFEQPETPENDFIKETSYYITRKPIDNLPIDRARLDIDECEVVLAFPMDDNSSPIISTQDVFAFLPIRSLGFKFLIQADFILQASRQDVLDSARNKAILRGVAEAFRDSVVSFCESESPLRIQWMRFLPSAEGLDSFWRSLPTEIIELLSKESILFSHNSSSPQQPGLLRTLPEICVDRYGLPLFDDRPGNNRKYLSLEYNSRDIRTLSRAFGIHDIEGIHMVHRINQDLSSDHSKMKATDTEDDWHTRSARLLQHIMSESTGLRNMIKSLPLVPTTVGDWVMGSKPDLYFPTQSGPEIPKDLLKTVHPRAIQNRERTRAFEMLGITHCLPTLVLDLIWQLYLSQKGSPDLDSSITHLRYLYWNYHHTLDQRFTRLWVYNEQEIKVTSRQKLIYFSNEDEFGPRELLKSVQDPRNSNRMVRECPGPVSFLHSAYIQDSPGRTSQHRLTWTGWLEKVLGVRRIVRLKLDGGSLSPEFRHVLALRPDKLVGLLGKHWDIYADEITPTAKETISHAEVFCLDGSLKPLGCTYLPLPDLKCKVEELGITRGFPFLSIPGVRNENSTLRPWRFLSEFDVGFETSLEFYMEVLMQHESRNQRPWNSETRKGILKTYENITLSCSRGQIDWIREKMDEHDLILHPDSFLTTCSAPTWTDAINCVWHGPQALLDKVSLASVPDYQNNEILSDFFLRILGIENAKWKDYLEMLLNLKRNPGKYNNISTRVLGLYELFAGLSKSKKTWDVIRENFETEGLMYIPITSTWFSPSNCFWTSPVTIDGKAIIKTSYPSGLEPFFVRRLKVLPAELDTLVNELHSLSQRHASVPRIKDMIWAINASNPEKGNLESIMTSDILPIRSSSSNSSRRVSLQSCQSNFMIIDRIQLANLFEDQVDFLDFTLEETKQLEPFLHALNLETRYLSTACEEATACTRTGQVDNLLTAKFNRRAYDLLRCSVHFRSCLAATNLRALYDRFLRTEIVETNNITTKYTLRTASGNIVMHTPRGYVHVSDQDDRWKIYVPQDRRDRELCYLRHLPEALTKLLQIGDAAREIIGNIINSSAFVIDSLLETVGIGQVSGIDPPRRVDDELSEQESTASLDLHPSPEFSLRSTNLSSHRNVTNILRRPSIAPVDNLYDADTPVAEGRRRSLTVEFQPRQSPSPRITPDSSPDRTPPASPEPVPDFIGRDLFNYDAYRELLDNVIRIANRSNLPRQGDVPQPNNVEFHQGFEHEAAFGSRSQNQMAHDTRIGAAGELFVFEMLSDLYLPNFSRDNWKSTIRNQVTIHPDYADMRPWVGVETADITYQDTSGTLTKLLIAKGYLAADVWRGAKSEYFIEVKTTTGTCADRLFMSNRQYVRMQEMTLPPDQSAARIYVIFRVYHISRNSLDVKIYVDPETYRQRGELEFTAQSWTVKPNI